MDSWKNCSIYESTKFLNHKKRHLQPTSCREVYNRAIHSSKFKTALIITIAIIFIQLVLAHYYVIVFYNNREKSITNSSGDLLVITKSCLCRYPNLGDIYFLAQKLGIELVIIDLDLLQIIENKQVDNSLLLGEARVRSRQESIHKSIIHLAAINETSGGQPSIRLFLNALKRNGYTFMQYEESSKTMPPEVYQINPYLFEDNSSIELNAQQNKDERSIMYARDQEQEEKVSKIYTEFIGHIFVLNATKSMQTSASLCKTSASSSSFIVIHIVVLYNYEYDEENKWIQPYLGLNEVDRHKLLSYNVHSVDFKLPIERDFIHNKRPIINLANFSNTHQQKLIPLANSIKIFHPSYNSRLSYANNSYIHCRPSGFNISNLIDNAKPMSNYLKALDSSQLVTGDDFRTFLLHQFSTAFQFMDTYSRAYNNFTYWITGSTLLSYHKNCDILSVTNRLVLEEEPENQANDIILNLELGLFASEVSSKILEDLSAADSIGVTMLSDWRKQSSIIMFTLQDCPNILFNLYLYERRRDFYQDYYVTQNLMTRSHKLGRRLPREGTPTSLGHHVFKVDNMELCWTRIDRLHPFRVPCSIHDHLRRIYVI